MTNKKSTTNFPVSLRWTVLLPLKPLKGGAGRKIDRYLRLDLTSLEESLL